MAEAPPPDPEPEPEPEPSSPESIASKSNSVIHRKPSMLVLIKNKLEISQLMSQDCIVNYMYNI